MANKKIERILLHALQRNPEAVWCGGIWSRNSRAGKAWDSGIWVWAPAGLLCEC